MSTQSDLTTASESARTTDYPIQRIPGQLVKRIADTFPITAAGVSLISASAHPRLVVGSNESASRYQHRKADLDEGPWRAALATLDETACLEVAGGLGTHERQQQNRFAKFFCSSTSYEHEVQGTDLDPTPDECIVANDSGDISVVSDHFEGTMFTLAHPLARGASGRVRREVEQ